MTALQANEERARWYVMRDLKRTNAKEPAYKMLEGKGMDVFVPMKWRLVTRGGTRVREEVPFISDLLFAHETRGNLDPVVDRTRTLQYRWLRGTWREPMTVADADMERFINAVNAAENPKYYLPEELKPDMFGRLVRIVGGVLDGFPVGCFPRAGRSSDALLWRFRTCLPRPCRWNPNSSCSYDGTSAQVS